MMERQVSEDSFLSDDFLRQLISVGNVDLLVGILSRNDSSTIGKVVSAAEEGLLRKFPRERIALVHVDGGSKDGTSEALKEASTLGASSGMGSLRTLRWISTGSENSWQPANMVRTVLTAADLLHAKGCAVLAASTENATPSWVESLLLPVYREDYDFVAPLYSRHKYDGLLTRNFLYPLCRALYGKPVRELRASEFAFSGRLAGYCLSRGEWQNEGLQGGAEMWLAITAMSNGFRCVQAYLGEKPRAKSNAGVVDAIRHAVNGLFWCLESTESYWLKGAAPDSLPTTGPEHKLTSEPIRVERKKLFQMYKSGVAELSQILSGILNQETHAELNRLADAGEEAFRFSNALWVRIVYEFAAAYHHSVINRSHLVQAFVPIYRGRVYSFLTQHRSAGSDAMEADLENLCQEFDRQRDFFFERWRTKGQGAS
jgi:glucosylglycerate synthase